MLLLAYFTPLKSSALLIAECEDIDFVYDKALVVVSGQVSGVESKKEKDGNIYTYVDIRVEEYIKGAGPKEITIRQLGGSVGDEMLWAEDVPTFKVDERGYMFLSKPDTAFYQKKYYSTVCGRGITAYLPDNITANQPKGPLAQNNENNLKIIFALAVAGIVTAAGVFYFLRKQGG